MKTVTINTGWHVQHFLFEDDAKADEAYKTLKEAMSRYERFGNDKEKTVSIGLDDVGEQTIKLDHLISVGIEDLSEARDDIFVQSAKRNARLKEKVKVACPQVETTTLIREAERGAL